MPGHFDILDIAVLHEPGSGWPDKTGHPERFTLDFLVNGRSLHQLLGADELGMVGRFACDYPDHNGDSAKVFLLEAAADYDGKSILFGCGICLDLGCGAILVEITRVEGGWLWSGFSYDNGWAEWLPDTARYEEVYPFYFSEENYADVIERAATFVRRE
ncbi:MAG: hypothetical protein KF712_00565 [Akkermansiaceae bacterium]|nr:hypothetical protein [Akkermansiaceae bacterium]